MARVDWRSVMLTFRRWRISDKWLVRVLSRRGIKVDRSTLCYLRSGKLCNPNYDLGAELLSLQRDMGGQVTHFR